MKLNRFKFCFDIGVVIFFILLFSPEVTSLAFHEIVGIILGLAFLIHLLLNIEWIKNVSKKFFSRSCKGKTKLSYLLNFVLLIDMLIIIISGLLISEIILPNFRYFTTVNWHPLHIVSSILGLIIVGIHLGLHWNWIKHIGTSFPKLAKLFSFRKPSRKVVSRLLLIIGTISLLVQLPKLVVLTPMIFSDQAFGLEERHRNDHNFSEEKEFNQLYSTKENEVNREGEEFGESGEFERHHKPFSMVQLVGIVPVLIIYSTIFGAIAFYTHFIEQRSINKRRI